MTRRWYPWWSAERDAYHGIIEIVARLTEVADPPTEVHARRVAGCAVEIARAMGLRQDLVEDVRVGALVHDIGKADVSAHVLRKAARLTDDEFDEIKHHVDHGARMMHLVGGTFRNVIPMVAYHHERWDGTGYKGLRGEVIPLGARIIAVADAYDAIVTDRAYRPSRSHAQAIDVIRQGSGTQFDPRVVDAFTALHAADGALAEATDGAAA